MAASTSQQSNNPNPPSTHANPNPISPPALTARSPPALLHLPSRPSPLGSGPLLRRTSSSTPDSSVALMRAALGRVPSGGGKGKGKVLGIQDRLRREVDGVVKRRQGGVLGRGYILKTGPFNEYKARLTRLTQDHYPTGRALDLDLTIQGAPNFRAPDEEGLNVYGVAQPTVPGLRSILTILGCQPHMPNPPSRRGSSSTPNLGAGPRRSSGAGSPQDDVGGADGIGAPLQKTISAAADGSRALGTVEGVEKGRAIWFSTREETLIYCNGRPYVLRDAAAPFSTLALSDRATNLEDIERRLKLDILDEARRYGGMILTHDEVSGQETVPTWVSVDEASIQTPKEVWEEVKEKGWRVDYWRIPIAPDRPIEDNYLDAYVRVINKADPLTTSLVFNCGMGVVRTTFGMIAAMLVRRQQFLQRGLDDPFPTAAGGSGLQTPAAAAGNPAAQFLEQATHQQALNKSLLRLTRILDRNLPSKHPSSAIDLLASQPNLLEVLRKAHMGNYQIVLSLLSSLDHGRQMKRLVDHVIDSCDAVVNLRENVLEYRIKYSVVASDEKTRQAVLQRAVRSLEQYFDLIVFAAYLEEEEAGDSGVTFSQWLKSRPEIWNQIKILRRQGGNRLLAFAPANDLSVISRSSEFVDGQYSRSMIDGRERKREVDLQGGKVLGDEWADHVVKNRNGIILRASTLLKSDLWLHEAASSSEGVRGAIGFRQIRDSSIFATGQPTEDALSTILKGVHERCPNVNCVLWICLREEPLVMINGSPYCLRRDSTALRNIRDYTGVSASRLEVLEERLKSDVVAELDEFQGRILLHTETADGEVVPVWESVDKQDVASIREIMDEASAATTDVQLSFIRIPITSESSPDFHDLTELLELCQRTDLERTAIVLNDQLGRGRSTTTAVIVLLIQRWLKKGRETSTTPKTPVRGTRPSMTRRQTMPAPKTSWQVINSCLRVIRSGLEVKRVVDEAIDATATHFNLRDTIEDLRVKAEEATDPEEKQRNVERAIYHLQRYYHLLLFQAYLDDRTPDEENPYSFESFVKHRPVFKTLEKELLQGGLESLTPIERMDPAAGMALPDEVSQAVASRSGTILSAQTILKSDFFSGLQKQSLPERVEGAANYRKLPIMPDLDGHHTEPDRYVYGTGMPSATGLRNALEKMGAGPGGPRSVIWTSLREEPVLYVKSRPHVLRLLDKPLTNVETTGVTAAVVERMETQLKEDVLHEIRKGEGRVLLHDEVETKPGSYEIIPIWENVQEHEVMTPREMYQGVIEEHYRVDYARVAITDEQAPLPASLQVIVGRVAKGLKESSDFVFNCQMGRGRTTTGMVAASLIATIATEDMELERADEADEEEQESGEMAEMQQYLNGEYKTILQLVTVLSHGKQAKRVTDKVVNLMEGVQNLRKAVYEWVPSAHILIVQQLTVSFKVKVDAAEPGSSKHATLSHQAVNYLYRYGTLIVLANFLLEAKEQGLSLDETDFASWLQQHREIRSVLSRKTLD
ncbi:inositol hexakisphosphate-domain-containing protein [Papiliotrema laurentii]|uniref:Inositol hexakisphosphate-domain-containing protein n=1 Tax=Papiliotrema laurentii TaxID=5418 RepID=A0AAD9CYI4_PAPLA|nr:inositol hexakisphosphate-domain-containing protein [Papiliotrema laurentii]